MPRQSAEARAAAALRAGGSPPKPPRHLSREAAAIWIAVANSRPPDFFDAAGQVLLGEFCECAVHGRALQKRIQRLRRTGAWQELVPWERRYAAMTAALTRLAIKLRLTVQARFEWHDGRIAERGHGRAGKHDWLLGGRAVHGDKGGKAN